MNLFDQIPENLQNEDFKELLNSGNLIIERIVSKGHASPESGWYDQQRPEWVLLIKGRAQLEFQDGRVLHMQTGDYTHIPAHEKHRVAWTDPDDQTIWLAIHYTG